MIFGIGTDLVSVARIEATLQKHGAAFPQRILTASELTDYAAAPHPARFLAKRFAAKEALAKATGQGLNHPVSLRHITVGHDTQGKPAFQFTPELEAHLLTLGVARHHLSLSDEHEHALAFVVLEEQGRKDE
jgi:holo-[acyl-carrier protein] synthase